MKQVRDQIGQVSHIDGPGGTYDGVNVTLLERWRRRAPAEQERHQVSQIGHVDRPGRPDDVVNVSAKNTVIVRMKLRLPADQIVAHDEGGDGLDTVLDGRHRVPGNGDVPVSRNGFDLDFKGCQPPEARIKTVTE